MQWLIDIILELVQPMLAALKVTIHGQLGFFDRGDIAAADFARGDFVTDNAWHTLDLSAVVPADARAVLVRIRLRCTVNFAVCRFRTNGYANDVNISQPGVMVANLFHRYDLIVIPDSNRVLEYKITNTVWTNIDFTIGGWWLR